MHSLEKLAMMKAISDRSWLGCAMLFQQLTKGMAQMLLETCLEQRNTAAFEEFLLNLRQEKLVIRNNLHFNQEFAMLVANIIQKNRSFEATKITEIDFAGCAIGPLATKKFCEIAMEQMEFNASTRIDRGAKLTEYKAKLSKMCINLHVTREIFDEVCNALQAASSILRPYAIKADALGRKKVNNLLCILTEKLLPLYGLDLYMNSLEKEGVIDVCNHLKSFEELRSLDLAYAMISEEDADACKALSVCLRGMNLLQSLNLSANILGSQYVLIFENLPVKSIRKLDLSNCGLANCVCRALAERLQFSEICTLILSCNPFRKKKHFVNLLLLITNCRNTLTRLEINNIGLTYANTVMLIQCFNANASSCRLAWLEMENKDIKREDVLWDEMRNALPNTAIKWR